MAARTAPLSGLMDVFRSGLIGLSLFTFVVNVLLLVQPLYMLQVYDRVLNSGSLETLVFISLIAAGALVLLGLVDAVRSMIASRIAVRMEVEAGADALLASLNGPRSGLGDIQPLRDLATVRGFVANRGLLAFLDLPFAPLFIGLLYFIHPHLFWMTLAGAAVLGALAFLNERATGRAVAEGEIGGAMAAMLSAQAFAKNAETIAAMGMVGNVTRAWGRDEARSLQAQEVIARANSFYSGLSRTLRLGLQIAVLGYGGYLVVAGEMTAGMIFAASLISGRGLQPIDQVIGSWKSFVEARKAWERLKAAVGRSPVRDSTTELPAPDGALTLDQLIVFPAGAAKAAEPLLKRISARILAGECTAVIGPSGAGKSTLVRTLIGAIEPSSGSVRIDGADIRSWDRERLGRHIGYLSQEVDLLPGTIAQNIARFDEEADGAAIVRAARKAEVHEMILRLGKGYDTQIGPGGLQLSGGQRQRIGLARAFFGEPRLMILDEPNANLDTEGDLALDRALATAREEKVTVVIVTQRRPIAERADKIMILRDGALEEFGPRQEVFERQAQRARAAQAVPRAVAGDPARLPQPVVAGRFTSVVRGGMQAGQTD